MKGIVNIKIMSEGKAINTAYPISSLEINYQINKIPYAKLVYSDADGYTGKFKITDDEAFKPGKIIAINLRHEKAGSKDKTIFQGIILEHKIKTDKNHSSLILELRHPVVNLTASRNNAIYLNKTDKEIFEQICSKHTSMKFTADAKTTVTHKQMVQNWCSDWDFILSRAESCGLWLIADNNKKLNLIDPTKANGLRDSKVVIDLNAGSEIHALELSIDILNQVNNITAEAWNPDKQVVLTEMVTSKETIDFKKIEAGKNYKLFHTGNLQKEELQAWAHSKLVKNHFSLLKGKIKLEGILEIEPGMTITLKNLGKYFNGKHLVNSVRHIINLDGFKTELGLGMPADRLISLQGVQAPLAGGLMPGVNGLQIGVVKEYAKQDKAEDQLLVKVGLSLFGKENNEILARLSSIYAGANRGVVFRPEPGDEVVLGFFNDDPRYPVILGSMYSTKNKPPIEFSKENELKTIVTKEKMAITFNEKTKSIDLVTSKDSKISISTEGDKPGITLEDKNKNSLMFQAGGIICASKAEMEISAQKAVFIKASKIEVK